MLSNKDKKQEESSYFALNINNDNNNKKIVFKKENLVLLYNQSKQKQSISSIANKRFDNLETLKLWGTNLSIQCLEKKNSSISNREIETEFLLQSLSSKICPNILILGDTGVGKTELVKGLAWKLIYDKTIPNHLQNNIIVQINPSDFASSTKYVGELEEKIKKIIKECSSVGNVILFIDEIHGLIRSGSTNINDPINAAQILKPLITSDNRIKIIGATTYVEYHKYLEKDKAFVRRFQILDLKPTTIEETNNILQSELHNFESFHNIFIDKIFIEKIVYFSDIYINSSNFPDKALKLLDKSCIKANFSNKKNLEEIDIYNALVDLTKLPIEYFYNNFSAKLISMEKILLEKIIGQDKAIVSFIKELKIAFSDIGSNKSTKGNFLFTGSTGVGKTELAKIFAEHFHGKNKYLRLDMSEYSNTGSYRQLIGATSGLLGSDEGGQLTDWVKDNTNGVIIFDEVEKAHQEVINLLLQILDAGRLTDNKKNTVSFKNIIIILTSNIFVTQKNIGFSFNDNSSSELDKLLEERFSKEFLSRLKIIDFNLLVHNNFSDIIIREFSDLQEKLNKKSKRIFYTDEVLGFLLLEFKKPKLGVRELKRVFEDNIIYPISIRSYEEDWIHLKVINISVIDRTLFFDYQ